METAASKPNVGLSYGLIAGLIITVITLCQYLGGMKWFDSPVGYLSYLLLTAFAVAAALKKRKNDEGFIEFSNALKVTFTVFVIGLLVQTVFAYILFNFIDTDFREAVRVRDEINSEKFLRKLNYSQSRIDESIEIGRKFDRFSIVGTTLGYAISCIISFVFCLLISLIIKRSKPQLKNFN